GERSPSPLASPTGTRSPRRPATPGGGAPEPSPRCEAPARPASGSPASPGRRARPGARPRLRDPRRRTAGSMRRAGSRSRAGAAPACRRAPAGQAPSHELQPRGRLLRAHRAREPGSQPLVLVHVPRREVGIGGVPDLYRLLMATQDVLEDALVAGPSEEQPARLRIPDAVRERRVQAPGDLVDEVIHVALDAAVVVARKHHPLPVV